MNFGRAGLERHGRGVERVRAGADDGDDFARHLVRRDRPRRVRPDAGRQRPHEVRHVRPAAARVAIREHDLAGRLRAPLAIGLEVQPQQFALRLDLEQPRPIANLRLRDLLEPSQVIGPGEARNAVELVERLRAVQRLVPGPEAERDVAAFGARRQCLRRAQLMHARDRSPDAGLSRLGAIDDVRADAFALQRVPDRDAALAGADDHDVVVHAGARLDPLAGTGARPPQHAAGLRVELLARVHTRSRRGRAARHGADLRESGRSAQTADTEQRRSAQETAAVDTARSLRRRFLCGVGLRRAFVGHAVFLCCAVSPAVGAGTAAIMLLRAGWMPVVLRLRFIA